MEHSAVQKRMSAASSRIATHRARDGLELTVECYGEPLQPALLYTHGFGQSRVAWHNSALNLAEAGWPGISLDGRGHGDSGWSPDGEYSLDHFLDDLRSVTASLPEKPVLIGASMGGLLGIMSEGESAGQFRAMVLVDVTPRWESAGVDRILSFMSAHPLGFDSLQEAADAISQYLPHRERKNPERLRTQLRESSNGRWRWHWDPKLLAQVGEDIERHVPRLQAAAAKIQIPVLLLSGGRSDVISHKTIAEFLELVPHAEHVQIEDATHMVVGDRNDAFTREILSYLGRLKAPDVRKEP